MVADFTCAGRPALGEAPESGERGTVAAMDDDPCKVVGELDDAMPEAATPQKAGGGPRHALYFRDDETGLPVG
jgi:hypothetical protein